MPKLTKGFWDIQKHTSHFKRRSAIKGFIYLMNDSYKLLDTLIFRDKAWLMQRKKIVFFKVFKKVIKMIRSNAFLQIGSKEIGLYFLRSCLSPFLWVGTMFAFFHWSGNIPVRGQFSNRSFNGFKIDLWNNFNILIEISSYRWALLASEDFGIFKMPDSFMLTERNNDVVIEDLFIGNLLRLFIKEHWFAKTSLKWFAFSLKLVTKWSFMSRGGIIGTFFQLVKDLRTLQ